MHAIFMRQLISQKSSHELMLPPANGRVTRCTGRVGEGVGIPACIVQGVSAQGGAAQGVCLAGWGGCLPGGGIFRLGTCR